MERSSDNSGKFHSGEIIIISGEIIIQPENIIITTKGWFVIFAAKLKDDSLLLKEGWIMISPLIMMISLL